MKEVEIKITDMDRHGVQAMAFYEGKPIDQHFHSSESWLLDDWGFFGGEGFHHDKTLLEKMALYSQARKLKNQLLQIKNLSFEDRYEIENFAAQLERLAFLLDPTATEKMSRTDKIIYQQARHTDLHP